LSRKLQPVSLFRIIRHPKSTIFIVIPVVQSITPLQAVELRPRDRLLVVTCDYQLADKTKAGADLEDRFVLAAESVGFNLITALLPQGTAAS
jgi:hypothetical protein